MEIVLPPVDSVTPLTPTSDDVAGIDMMTDELLSPTLSAPIALNVIEPAPTDAEDVTAVVLPTAKIDCAPAATVPPEMISVFEDHPTVTAPVPDTESASGSADDVEELTVVLPTTNRLRLGRGDEIWYAPAPAAVVENPTLTAPAPLSDMLLRVWVLDDESPVVLPIAYWFWTVPEAGGPEMTSAPAPAAVVEYPTLTPPAPDIDTELRV
jgi:hypothetical protein